MSTRGKWGLWSLLLCAALSPMVAYGQCMTQWAAGAMSELEYIGLDSRGTRNWAGQRFSTNCDGKFLSVSFLVYLSVVPYDGVRSLTVGDKLVCSILDGDYRTVASVEQVLTFGFNSQWVDFDFSGLDLGLAAGDLTARLDTPHDAFGYLNSGASSVPGHLVVGHGGDIIPRERLDTAFRVTWDPYADVVGAEARSWSAVKSLYR